MALTKKEHYSQLQYRLINASSEDPEFSMYEIVKGQRGRGWVSTRFCGYPQEILIQFYHPVNIKQVNILINEKKIPSMIEFSSFFSNNFHSSNQVIHPEDFEEIGYIKPSNNSKTNYKAREYRKIYMDVDSTHFKITLRKNYLNRFNLFNQVGIVGIEFFGIPHKLKIIKEVTKPGTENEENTSEQKETLESNDGVPADEDLDNIAYEKIKVLRKQMNKAIESEDYDECKNIKKVIDDARKIGREIFSLEKKKKKSIYKEDFDNAKLFKGEIDKLKIKLKLVDKQKPNDISFVSEAIPTNGDQQLESSTANNKFNNLNINSNSIQEKSQNPVVISENTENDSQEFKKKSVNTSLSNINNASFTNKLNDISTILGTTFQKLNKKGPSLAPLKLINISKSQKNLFEEELISYDDIILPTVWKKIIPEETPTTLEESGIAEKGELEELDQSTIEKHQILVDFIGLIGLRKILSKQILWKEEGFNILISKMDDIFDKKNDIQKINEYIVLIMKMIIKFLDEKHPTIITKALDLFQTLLICISNQSKNLKITYDFNITDRILLRIKEKLGDVSPKIRAKAVNLYFYMLQQDFCDYDNLIAELVEEELKNNYDSEYPKIKPTTKLTLGKLAIFSKVLDDVKNAFNSKRTSEETFPYDLLADYLIKYLNHSKSEVRKLTRLCIGKYIKEFGAQKLIAKLQNVESRELGKLIEEIPELSQYFPDFDQFENSRNQSLNASTTHNMTIGQINTTKVKPNKYKLKSQRSSSTSLLINKNVPKPRIKLKPIKLPKQIRMTTTSAQNKKTSAETTKRKETCIYCDEEVDGKENLKEHWEKKCKYFINCKKCGKCIEVKEYNNHLLYQCKFKKDFKLCKRCKEAIEEEIYDKHIKDGSCNPAKKQMGRCPLCHLDIPPFEKGFIKHLIKDGCERQSR